MLLFLFFLNFLFNLLHMEGEETLRPWKSHKTAHGELSEISVFLLAIVRDTKNWCETERKSPQT